MPYPRSIFIGCATDQRFVEPTAVMLTSLDANGQVPEATVVIACFGLDDRDQALLRIAAGRLAGRIEFLDVGRDMLHEVDPDKFTAEYPPAVLGRLFVANHITQQSARLLTLDSDMIVNTSLRPLFELDLGSEYFAAIHDPPRKDDPNYFNSGLTLCEVDRYRYFDIAHRALQYIAEHRPHFPDQDALNHVVGDSWHRLHRLWNYFYSGDREFSLEDYEVAKVAHFCGWKPWDHAHHPATPLYARYLKLLRERFAQSGLGAASCGDDFVATCYEVFLGRNAESLDVIRSRSGWSRTAAINDFLTSPEFRTKNLAPLLKGRALGGRPDICMRQRLWIRDQLPLTHASASMAMSLDNRSEVLTMLLSDRLFRDRCKVPLQSDEFSPR